MVDEWSGLTDMLVNLIEKYASDLDIDNIPDITVDNHAEGDRNKAEELSKNCKMCLANNDHKKYNKHDKSVQTNARENTK